MLFNKRILLVLLFSLTTSIQSQVIPQKKLICPDSDLNNCYPRIFEPTHHWKEILPDQEIPGGLHVRLNMDTLKREGKLLDEAGSSDMNTDLEVVPVNDEHEELRAKIASHKENIRKPDGERTDFQYAINEVDHLYKVSRNHPENELDIHYSSRLLESLNILVELSHDLDYGIKISLDNTFEKLNSLSHANHNHEIKEKCYRIMAAALRNNPIAIDNILLRDINIFNELLEDLDQEENSVLQKRILGVIGGLIQSDQGKQKIVRIKGNQKLVKTFSKLHLDAQTRITEILEDLNVQEASLHKRSEEMEDDLQPNSKLSKMIQTKIVQEQLDSPDLKFYFNQLLSLHKNDKSLKPESDFVNWIIKENEERANDLSRRDNDDYDEEFDRLLKVSRHEVFGNPMGLRKALADEL